MNIKTQTDQLTDIYETKSEFINNFTATARVKKFWESLVRDANGTYSHLTNKSHYYAGVQPHPNLHTTETRRYLRNSIDMKATFIHDFKPDLFHGNMHYFIEWLKKLHRLQAYKGTAGKLDKTQRNYGASAHTPIILLDVIPLAKKYKDPYINKGKQTLYLNDIPLGGLPYDMWNEQGTIAYHYYPPMHYFHFYIKKIQECLYQINHCNENTPLRSYLDHVAEFYQYAINARMFEKVNHSLFTNIVNCLIERVECKPIGQGIVDFVALRLQPVHFKQFFYDEVTRNGDQTAAHYMNISATTQKRN